MARQQYQTAPYVKHLEVFNDFSGGLNTVDTNDKLRNNELVNISNMDLSERGSLKRRKGMLKYLNSPTDFKWAYLAGKKWRDL